MTGKLVKPLAAMLVPLTLIAGQVQSRPLRKEPPQPYLIPEAYAVYSTILSSHVEGSKSPRVLIVRETKGHTMCLEPDSESKEAVDPAIADYTEQNQKTWLIGWKLQITTPYEIVPRETLDSVLREPGGGWRLFERLYPSTDGWIDLSAVGFNSDKTIAVVAITYDRGPSGGSGGFRVLKLEDNKWVEFGEFGCGFAWAS
jgi:hypothetical protein